MTGPARALVAWTAALLVSVAGFTFTRGDVIAGCIALATLAVIAREVHNARREA